MAASDFEQSYLATMLEKNSYDTVCHEHLEYYALEQIRWMTERVGFEIVDGSSRTVSPRMQAIPDREATLKLHKFGPYQAFEARVGTSAAALVAFIAKVHREGKTIAALGASTKGKVVLQYCRRRRPTWASWAK